MRPRNLLAAVACIGAVCALQPPSSAAPATVGQRSRLAVRGPEPLPLTRRDARFVYGPTGAKLRALLADTPPTATFLVDYDGASQFIPEVQAAFQAAVDIWARTLVSPSPIRVFARFGLFANSLNLGVFPTVLCYRTEGDAYYVAALADKLNGARYCAASGGETYDIVANIDPRVGGSDFGTTGVGDPDRFNFMTYVLHEFAHALGFAGSVHGGESGNLLLGGYSTPPFIYDRFIENRAGTPLLSFPSGSAALYTQLTSDALFFNGPAVRAATSGARAKIEAQNLFGPFGGDPTISGSGNRANYAHLDDRLYTGTSNGLMTFLLDRGEVYTDVGSLTRAILQDQGWGVVPPACRYSIDRTTVGLDAAAFSGSVVLTTADGCAWTATSRDTAIATLTGARTGSGSATIAFSVAANTTANLRQVVVPIADQMLTIEQTGLCAYVLNPVPAGVSSAGGSVTINVSAQSWCPWTASGGSDFATIIGAAAGTGNGSVVVTFAPNDSASGRGVAITIGGRTAAIGQAGARALPLFSTQPVGQTIALGTSASFSVVATGKPAPFYGWERRPAGGSTFTIASGPVFSGVNSPTLLIRNPPQSMSGDTFRCVITNDVGYAISSEVVLSIAGFEVDRTSLQFSAIGNGTSFTAQTPPQSVRVTQRGAGSPVAWTATSYAPWLRASIGDATPDVIVSSAGSATLSVSVHFVAEATLTNDVGTILVAPPGGSAQSAFAVIIVRLARGTSGARPIGVFDTPVSGTTGIAGSVAVTGWALDDVGVSRVTICRDPVVGEPSAVNPLCDGPRIYIGDAVFVDGARPDVQTASPNMPLNTRAGWGYMMLTNFLPNGGNGTFTLRAYAKDLDGHSTELGSKVITVDNLRATAPFGAIDTPAQGEVVCGASYLNFGWALTQPAKDVVADSSTITVVIDGVGVGHPGMRAARPDITAVFPAYDTTHAVGGFALDTTSLANGMHSIAWFVSDSGGRSDGIGSRFFTVSNPCGSGLRSDSGTTRASEAPDFRLKAESTELAPTESVAASLPPEGPAWLPPSGGRIKGRRGFDLNTPYRVYRPDAHGVVTVQSEELDRIELLMGATEGYLLYRAQPGSADDRSDEAEPVSTKPRSGEVGPMPAGSHLDRDTGTFTWMPGAGFVGAYDFVFLTDAGAREVRIVLNPKGSNRTGPQTIIDIPSTRSHGPGPIAVGSAFFLAGWAADLDSPADSGIAAIHVWAYPVNEAGQRLAPVFVGPGIYGGARPDVAAIYGDRFEGSGYGLIVQGLSSGTYDVAVFAFSNVLGNFAPAAVVRVQVR